MAISRLGAGKRVRPALSFTTTGAARIVDLLNLSALGKSAYGSPVEDFAWSMVPPKGNEYSTTFALGHKDRQTASRPSKRLAWPE
jgi:hypothetical protein